MVLPYSNVYTFKVWISTMPSALVLQVGYSKGYKNCCQHPTDHSGRPAAGAVFITITHTLHSGFRCCVAVVIILSHLLSHDARPSSLKPSHGQTATYILLSFWPWYILHHRHRSPLGLISIGQNGRILVYPTTPSSC